MVTEAMVKLTRSRDLRYQWCDNLLNSVYTKPGFYLFIIFKKNVWDLAYPGQNRDVIEILNNLIGCLEDWELEKTDFLRKIKFL